MKWLRDYQERGLRVMQEYGNVSFFQFQQNNVYTDTVNFLVKHGLAVETKGAGRDLSTWEITVKGSDALSCGRFEMVSEKSQMTETGRVVE